MKPRILQSEHRSNSGEDTKAVFFFSRLAEKLTNVLFTWPERQVLHRGCTVIFHQYRSDNHVCSIEGLKGW